MYRALTILAAVAALAVSAQPASAGSSNTKTVLYNGHAGLVTSGTADDGMKYVCDVPGFMDYTDDSCIAKSRSGSAPASALASQTRPFNDGLAAAAHSGGGVVPGDFAKSKVNGRSNGIIAILIG